MCRHKQLHGTQCFYYGLKSYWNQLELKHVIISGHMLGACMVKDSAVQGCTVQLELEDKNIQKDM